jgi:O-antigen ligase
LTKPFDLHPIYYGSSVALCLIILIFEHLNNSTKIIKNSKIILLLIIFFMITLMLLNSFILIISLIVNLLFILLDYFKKNKISLFKIISIVSLLMIVLFCFSNFLTHKYNGIKLKEDLLTTNFKGDEFTALKARKAKAYCSIRVIENNILFGVGVGDGMKELLESYKNESFQHGIDKEFNSHNQYLTTALYTGIIGLSVLLLLIFYLYFSAINNKNHLLTLFLNVFILFFLTESVLERQNGIVFFVFLSSVLSIKFNEKNK